MIIHPFPKEIRLQMKTLHPTIILILLSGIVIPLTQNANSMPDLSPQDLYKQSDMVFYGQVISKQAEQNSDYYQIKVITYYKNPQTSDSITVAEHKPEGGHVSYPQFEVGDRAIFYITKLDGINTISPYSQKAGGACDVHSFLGPEYFGSPDVYRGGYASNPRLLDVNGNAIEGMILTNQEVVLSYDDIWNNYPQERAIPVKISIQNEDNGHNVLNMTQNLQVQACDFAGNLKWNFVPTEIGNYVAKIDVDNKTKMTYGFSVVSDSTSNSKIIPLPLKQFKSGIAANDVKCGQGLQLVIKAEDGSPACVKSDTLSKLIERGWGTDLEIIKVKNANVSVAYRIDNGRILEVTAYGLSSTSSSGGISGSSILIVSMNAASNGTLIIKMPRILIDAKSNSIDDNFTVLSDGQEIQYTETSKTITSRTLSIPFQWGAKHIEIIGYGYYNKQPPPTE